MTQPNSFLLIGWPHITAIGYEFCLVSHLNYATWQYLSTQQVSDAIRLHDTSDSD